MNKLKLEDLAVESFATTAAQDRQGTVFGEECTCQTNCTCPGCNTCDPSHCDTACSTCPASCGDTMCGHTCEYSCPGQYLTCNDYCWQ